MTAAWPTADDLTTIRAAARMRLSQQSHTVLALCDAVERLTAQRDAAARVAAAHEGVERTRRDAEDAREAHRLRYVGARDTAAANTLWHAAVKRHDEATAELTAARAAYTAAMEAT